MAEKKRRIAVDLDGVLHDYTTWDGLAPTGDPVPGAQRFITNLLEDGYEVFVFSARAGEKGGPAAIRQWLSENEFPQMDVTDKKIPADVYVDDRGFRFEGSFDDALKFIHSDEAEPWTTRGEK